MTGDRRGEEGAALIIALVFILTMGLLAGVLVGLADTNLLATSNLEAQRVGQYAADGALEVAVQTVRYGSNCGTTSGLSVTIPTSGSTQDLTVWCTERGARRRPAGHLLGVPHIDVLDSRGVSDCRVSPKPKCSTTT